MAYDDLVLWCSWCAGKRKVPYGQAPGMCCSRGLWHAVDPSAKQQQQTARPVDEEANAKLARAIYDECAKSVFAYVCTSDLAGKRAENRAIRFIINSLETRSA